MDSGSLLPAGACPRVRRFYDEVWTRYLPEREASLAHLSSLLPVARVRGARVLDGGCGTGVFSWAFSRLGAAEVVGADISRGALTTARTLNPGQPCRFVEASLDRLPFGDGLFDLVWAWGAVEHTLRPWLVLGELDRVLRPGGQLLLALYKKSRWTGPHQILRAFLSRLPRSWHAPLSAAIACGADPLVRRFKRREKLRGGECLAGLVHDWFFVPVRHHFDPGEVRAWLAARGYHEELYIASTARFEFSSHFIVRGVKAGLDPGGLGADRS